MRKASASAVGIAQRFARDGFDVSYKKMPGGKAQSIVTSADIACEKAIRSTLSKSFPSYGFLGEEEGEDGSVDKRFLIDPIDGTSFFARGIPLWGNILALEVQGEIVAGVFALPGVREQYFATKGGGAFVSENGGAPTPVRVSSVSDVSDSFLFTFHFRKEPSFDAVPTTPLERACQVRCSFGGLFAASQVIRGNAEGYVTPMFNAWDFAAGKIILEEAGGKFTNQRGERTIYNQPYSIQNGGDWVVLTNGKIHNEVLRTGWPKRP